MGLSSKLQQLYDGAQFKPKWYSIFINPAYISRAAAYHELSELISKQKILSGKLLDFGCGTMPYRSLFGSDCAYTGVDIAPNDASASRRPDVVYYDGSKLPFPNSNFDSIFSTDVLEHVFEPDATLDELNRVLKKGGKMLLFVPFVWGEHEQPHDFGRYTSFGLAHLLCKHGFEIERASKSVPYIAALAQMLTVYLAQVLHTRNKYLNQLLCAIFIAPVSLLGIVLSAILPKRDEFYIYNIVVARKL